MTEQLDNILPGELDLIQVKLSLLNTVGAAHFRVVMRRLDEIEAKLALLSEAVER